MFIYFAYFIPGLFLSVFKNKYSKLWVLFVAIGGFFLCGGYMTGSDWRNYELYYSWFSEQESFIQYALEPGYILYSYLFYSLGIGYWPFAIFTKLFLYVIIIITLHKLSVGNRRFEINFYMIVYGLYLFIDGPIRNFIAIIISIGLYKHLIKRQFKKYLLFVLIAMSFHMSAIMLLFFYPLYPIKLSNKTLVLLFVIFNVVFVFLYRDIIINVMSMLSFVHPLIESKMQLYFIEGNEFEQNSILTLGVLFHVLIFFLLLYKRKSIEKQKMGTLIFWGSVCYIFLYRMASIVDILYRLQLYFSILYTLGIGAIFVNIRNKNIKSLYSMLLSLYLIYMLHGLITSNYKYIPYTNYITYAFRKELPYEYRSEYNLIYSPYKDKQ